MSDLVKSYIGLLMLGKSDPSTALRAGFEAIEAFRRDRFFQEALGIGHVPGSVWLRQQLETHASVLREYTDAWSVRLIRRSEAPITAENGFACLDFDTFVVDNSGTQKEWVGRTYQGVDGYTPIAAYLGNEGWCVSTAAENDTCHLEDVLDRINTSRDLYGDKGYVDGEREARLKSHGWAGPYPAQSAPRPALERDLEAVEAYA